MTKWRVKLVNGDTVVFKTYGNDKIHDLIDSDSDWIEFEEGFIPKDKVLFVINLEVSNE